MLYHDKAWLQDAWKRHDGNGAAIAREAGCSQSSVSVWSRKLGVVMEIEDREPLFRPNPLPEPVEDLVLTGNGAVTSDWHAPIMNFDLLDNVIESAEKIGATDWILAVGDTINQDATSDYSPKQEDAGLSPEILAVNYAVKKLLRTFDKIVITLGNHDERWPKTMGYNLTFERAMMLMLHLLTAEERSRVIIVNCDSVYVDTPEGRWLFCHTRQYTITQLNIPGQLADIERCHVGAGHRHHHSLGFSKSGYRIWELGGLFDRERTQYLKRYKTTHPLWQNGWGLLVDGLPYCPMLSPAPRCMIQ